MKEASPKKINMAITMANQKYPMEKAKMPGRGPQTEGLSKMKKKMVLQMYLGLVVVGGSRL